MSTLYKFAAISTMLLVFIVFGKYHVSADTQLRTTIPLGYVTNFGGGAQELAVDSTRGYAYITDTDNRSDGHYLWEVDEATNSVINSAVLLPTGNAGNGIHLGGVAVNPDTHKLYVADSSHNQIMVLDSLTLDVLTTIYVGDPNPEATGTLPYGLTVSRSSNKIYVSEPNSDFIAVIDGASNTLLTRVEMADTRVEPFGLAIDDQLHKLYITNRSNCGCAPYNSNSLSVLDTITDSMVTTIYLPNSTPNDALSQMAAVNPNNHKVYVTAINSSWISVVDGTSNTVIGHIDAGQAEGQPRVTYGVDVDPHTNKVFVSAPAYSPLQLIKIDSLNDSLVQRINIDNGNPRGLVVDPETGKVLVAQSTDPSGYAILGVYAEDSAPSVPSGLSAESPAKNPNLGWDASSGAISYNIYRNGANIGSSEITSYTDSAAPEGTNSYYVTSVNSGGESSPSNTVNVFVDKTGPSIQYSLSPTPNNNGWNNGNVTVSFTCSDNGSGIAVCPGSTTLTNEGSGQIITGTATDNAGNSASASAMVNIDKTAPVVSNIAWSSNPLLNGQSTTLSATLSDNLSGVNSVHYSINGGAAQAMTYDAASSTWKATFGSSLAVGTYNIVVTATDLADNTSTGTPDVLAVYTTSNGYVTGHAKLAPSAGDTMPIALDTSNDPASLVLGFSNVTAPTSGSFDIDYSIKNNKDEFELASTGISWIVIPDSSHASVLGTAAKTVYVNGVKTVTNNVPVRFDVTLGANGSADQITIKIFNPGDNPSTATPAYVISDLDSNGSNLRIHP